MPDTNSLFTVTSLITYGGGSLAVVVVSNTVRTLLSINNAWPPFITALVVAYLGAYYPTESISLLDGVVAFFNGCLLFTSALGLDQGLVRVIKGKPAGEKEVQGKSKVDWLARWI